MNINEIEKYLPQIVYGLCAAGAIFWIIRYRRSRDLAAWLQNLRQNAVRASKNEQFRQDELADAEARLAEYPVPAEIIPIRRRSESLLHIIPRVLFMLTFAGLFFTYMGIFPQPGKTNWERYAGPALLLLTAGLIILLEQVRNSYGRVQQLNRKYLLQKAGEDPERHNTMREVLKYYPEVSQLWIEHADQLAVSGRMEEALEAMKTARKFSPENLDMAFIELSFLLRAGKTAEAEEAAKNIEPMPRADTDPRYELYSAAVLLKRNEVKKARKNVEKALELDRKFSEGILPLDKSLADVFLLACNEGLIERSEEENTEKKGKETEPENAEQAENGASEADKSDDCEDAES